MGESMVDRALAHAVVTDAKYRSLIANKMTGRLVSYAVYHETPPSMTIIFVKEEDDG